jgi:hypothetical protein
MKPFLALLIPLLAPFLAAAPLQVADLRTEMQQSPVGVGTAPRFSWKLVTTERGKLQRAYQILAATDPAKLTEEAADLWNSKQQNTGLHTHVPWKGKKLSLRKKVHWKVRVWDEKEEPGPWSEAATFQVYGEASLPKLTRTSTFESSSPALNELYRQSVESLEKRLSAFVAGDPAALGNGAQVQRSARAMLYHFDVAPHLSTWLGLMDSSLTDNRTFPVAPGSRQVGSFSSEGAILVNHPVWWMSGDSRLPQERWKFFEDHMIFREKNDKTFKGKAWGEVEPTEGMSAEFLDLAYLGLTTRFIRELSGPAQQPVNVVRFQDYAARIRESFRKQFVTDQGSLKTDSQSAQLLALRSDVLKADEKQQVVADLTASLAQNGVEVGPIGAHFLPAVLTLTGQQDKAIAFLTNLTPAQQEIFAGNGVSAWLMAYLAGIDAGFPGFEQFRITPGIPTDGSLTRVKASHQSPVGEVSVHWQILDSGSLKVEVTIPAGAIAKINLPAKKSAKITEGGKTIEEAPAVDLLNRTDDSVTLISQSGSYSFLVE